METPSSTTGHKCQELSNCTRSQLLGDVQAAPEAAHSSACNHNMHAKTTYPVSSISEADANQDYNEVAIYMSGHPAVPKVWKHPVPLNCKILLTVELLFNERLEQCGVNQ